MATRNTGRSSSVSSPCARSTTRRAICRAQAPERDVVPRAPNGTTAMIGRGLTVLAEPDARVVPLPHPHDVLAARDKRAIDAHAVAVHHDTVLREQLARLRLAFRDVGAHEQIDIADLALAVGAEHALGHVFRGLAFLELPRERLLRGIRRGRRVQLAGDLPREPLFRLLGRNLLLRERGVDLLHLAPGN